MKVMKVSTNRMLLGIIIFGSITPFQLHTNPASRFIKTKISQMMNRSPRITSGLVGFTTSAVGSAIVATGTNAVYNKVLEKSSVYHVYDWGRNEARARFCEKLFITGVCCATIVPGFSIVSRFAPKKRIESALMAFVLGSCAPIAAHAASKVRNG